MGKSARGHRKARSWFKVRFARGWFGMPVERVTPRGWTSMGTDRGGHIGNLLAQPGRPLRFHGDS